MKRNNGYFMPTLLFSFFAIFFFISSWTLANERIELKNSVELWLLDNCDTGEEGMPEKTLLRFGTEAEDLLITALENGPDKRLVGDLEKSLNSKWDIRSEMLSSAEGTALGRANLEIARKVTREEYFTLERNSFILRFRDRANQGLALIGSDKSLDALKRVASDETSPLRRSAEEALQRIGRRLAK